MRTPRGRTIEGVGVTPDVPAELTLAGLARGKDTVIERAVAEILAR
jgi:C-terminal processing protease CtpA/Prc